MSDLSWVHQDSEAAVDYIKTLESENLRLAGIVEELETADIERDELKTKLHKIKEKLETAHDISTTIVNKDVLCHDAWQLSMLED